MKENLKILKLSKFMTIFEKFIKNIFVRKNKKESKFFDKDYSEFIKDYLKTKFKKTEKNNKTISDIVEKDIH